MKKSKLTILFLIFYAICTFANDNISRNDNIKTHLVTCFDSKIAMPLRSFNESGTSIRTNSIDLANIKESTTVKKYVWIPWLYIAAGASSATGVYTYTKSNSIYNKYPKSSNTKESEQYHADAERYDDISKIAFAAAAGFGTVGIIVHIKHLKKKKSMSLSYIPVTNGAAFGLTYKF